MKKTFEEVLKTAYDQYFDDSIDSIELPDGIETITFVSASSDDDGITHKYLVDVGDDVNDFAVFTAYGDNVLEKMFDEMVSALESAYSPGGNPDREYDAWADEELGR
jgi:hypothetical protein